jgi:hypothetical protein
VRSGIGLSWVALSKILILLLSNTVSEIKAVSFTGTPFTADGIMSYLESELQGGHSYRHPGIWLSVTEAKDQETKPMDTPYYAKAPAADSYKMGLYASRHAGPDVHYGRFGRDGHPPTDNPRERFSQNNPTTTLENIFIKPESDEEARASLGLLLLRIEGDLVAHFIPLLAHFWCTKVTIEGVPDPRAAIGIEGVETAVWVCLKSNFHQVFHHEGDINFKLKTNEYSRRWHAWGHWSGQDSTLAEKPTTKDLKDFSDEWARIWEGFLQFSDNYARDFKVYMMAVGVWKALISSLIPHLSQLTSA